jgi:septal ring factor EnvC (AmiA/AmiB activator)
MVAAVTRPLKRVAKYSFVAPKGVVRHAQKDAKGVRMEYADGEQSTLDDDKTLHKLQVSLKKQLKERAALEKDPDFYSKEETNDVKKKHKAASDAIAKLHEQAAAAQFA